MLYSQPLYYNYIPESYNYIQESYNYNPESYDYILYIIIIL
jgi:hypothetical protein